MANEVPYKLYAKDSGFGFQTLMIAPGTNTPYGAREVDLNTFKQISEASPQAKFQYQEFLRDPTHSGVLAAAEKGQTVGSGYSMGVDPLSGQSGWGKWDEFNAQQAANDAAVTAGTMRKEGVHYVSTGYTPPTPEKISADLSSQLKGTSYQVQPGDTLSQIAKKMGVSVSDISGYRSGNPNLIYAGETLSIKPKAPTAPSTSTSVDSLGTGTMPKLPTGGTTTPNYASVIAGIPTPQTPTTPTQAPTAAETTSKGLMDRITSAYGELTGKSAFEQSQMEQAGVPQQEKDVQELTNQLNQLKTESGIIPMQAQEGATGRGVTDAGIAPLTQAQLRQNAIKTLTVSAQLQAKQGNLTLAKDQVDRAVSMKYDAIEQEIMAKKDQLAILDKYVLTPAETKRKEEMELAITQAAEKAKELKVTEAAFEKSLADSIANGMPNTAVASARALFEAGREDEARIQMATYMKGSQESTDVALQRLQLAIEKAQGGGEDKVLSVTEAQALGVPIGTKMSQVSGIVPLGKPTEGQFTTANYATRLEQSNPIISDYKPLSDTKFFAAQKAEQVGGIANLLIPAADQNLFQAQRNFLNATLRRESGAVISPTEFADGARQYFPQPGDNEQVLAQKKANRDLVTRNFVGMSGNAYEQLTGNKPTTGTDTSGMENDIRAAVKDTANVKSREQLIQDIMKEYNVSQDIAASKVYGIWTDNTQR